MVDPPRAPDSGGVATQQDLEHGPGIVLDIASLPEHLGALPYQAALRCLPRAQPVGIGARE
jgi:hypothetical protein